MTIQEAAEKVFDASRTTYAEGCPVIGNDVELIGFTETTPKKYSEEELAAMEQSALKAAKEADLVVMPLGEHYLQSGEATSRAMIDVPEIQMELFHKVLVKSTRMWLSFCSTVARWICGKLALKQKPFSRYGSWEPRAEALLWMF